MLPRRVLILFCSATVARCARVHIDGMKFLSTCSRLIRSVFVLNSGIVERPSSTSSSLFLLLFIINDPSVLNGHQTTASSTLFFLALKLSHRRCLLLPRQHFQIYPSCRHSFNIPSPRHDRLNTDQEFKRI